MGKKGKGAKGSVANTSEARLAEIKLSGSLALAAAKREEAYIASIIEKTQDPITKAIAELAAHAERFIQTLEARIAEVKSEEALSSLAGETKVEELD